MAADLPMWVMMVTGGFSACVAEAFTIPFDTAKVRLQVQDKSAEGAYTGTVDCMKKMAAQEGLGSLWNGVIAGFQRQLVFASLRLGMYEPIRNYYAGGASESTLGVKVMAGLTTGTIAMCFAQPTDLVKVRLQGQGIAARNDPSKIKYKGCLDAYAKIFKQEGILSFWTGLGPNVMRNAVINAAELASFDQTKQMLIKYTSLEDGVPCHILSSACAGTVATTVGSPVDVIKTRIMNADKSAGSPSIVRVIKDLIQKEGLGAFYNGYLANAQRIVTWNILMFVTWGQMKQLAGKRYTKSAH